jgi:hypothetical protein
MQASVVAINKGQLEVMSQVQLLKSCAPCPLPAPEHGPQNSRTLNARIRIQVMSHVCDRAFGGKDLDEMLFQHFADEFKSKYKVDARTEQKASLRLKMQVRI